MTDKMRERLERAARNAGMLDAYLNIGGVVDEAEALAMLRSDLDDFVTELAADGIVVVDEQRLAEALGTVLDYPTLSDNVAPSWREMAHAILEALRR